MTPNLRRTRAGFTLVELLVVIAIIAFLAALIIAFFPSINAQSAEANGAANLQGWLNIARQKAIRNQNPYGLRMWVKDTTLFTPPLASPTFFVSECQYIEQPDDFVGGTLYTTSDGATVANIYGVDVTGGFSDPTLYPVQAGDYLEVLGTGLMHSIAYPTSTSVQYNLGNTTSSIQISSGIPFAIGSQPPATPPPYTPAPGIATYRILRAPRVIGSETLPLPGGVFIDLQTNTTYSNALPIVYLYPPQPPVNPPPNGAYVDVLFSPSGAVMTPGVTGGTMNLWVRQPDTNSPGNAFAGNPTIIAVFAQTGFVGAFPPSASAASPYVDIH